MSMGNFLDVLAEPFLLKLPRINHLNYIFMSISSKAIRYSGSI